MNCGKICKLLIMNKRDLPIENFKVLVAIIVSLDKQSPCLQMWYIANWRPTAQRNLNDWFVQFSV